MILVWLTVFAAASVVGLVAAAIPRLEQLESSPQLARVPGKVLAQDGTVLRRLRAPDSRTYVTPEQVPRVLEHAVIAAEDRRFLSHRGIDARGIARAAWVDLRSGTIEQGGSTITQQLVKNALVGSERSMGRKTREAVYAIALETRWDKQRIMTAYLNTAYFGAGAYGIRDASRIYFGTRPQRLQPAQAAMLAAALQAPETVNPVRNPRAARRARSRVITAMRELGFLTTLAAEQAERTPLPAAGAVEARRRGTGDELAPHFTDHVVGQVAAAYGVAETMGGGLRITTTLDPAIQRAANDAMSRIAGTGLGASVVVISARSGAVLAMAQGGSAERAAFNIAVNGQRQPGSAFKPFALAAALREGRGPAFRLESAPFSEVVHGTRWSVTNDGGYRGSTTLREATWRSDNTAYARLTKDIGVPNIVRAARDAGITSEITEAPAVTLGGLPYGVSPLELARAYATFANHGYQPRLRGWSQFITTAAHPQAGLLEDPAEVASPTDPSEAPVRAIERPIADEVTEILTEVITRGTGRMAAIGTPAAGKTGTSERNADAWFVGYTPNLVAAVWVGNPAGAVPMNTEYVGGPVSGGSYPAQIWADVMRAATVGRQDTDFSLKQLRFTRVLVDPTNGLRTESRCAGARWQEFVAGFEPAERSPTCQQAAPRPRAIPEGPLPRSATEAP
jgi:penicillin-binding protein 1A